MSTLVTNLGGITTIKAFTTEEVEAERVRAVSDAYRVANGEAIRYSSAFVPLIRMAILVGFTATLLIGGRLVVDGTLEVGIYSVLVFMTQRMLWPLTALGETLDLYQRAMASTRRILDLLDVRPTMVPGRVDLAVPASGDVMLVGVAFRYGNGPSVVNVGRGRTVIVIAHRLSTVRHADRIWVLERGTVAESGTHDELVRAGGLYAALWRVQTGEAADLVGDRDSTGGTGGGSDRPLGRRHAVRTEQVAPVDHVTTSPAVHQPKGE